MHFPLLTARRARRLGLLAGLLVIGAAVGVAATTRYFDDFEASGADCPVAEGAEDRVVERVTSSPTRSATGSRTSGARSTRVWSSRYRGSACATTPIAT